MSDLDRLQSMKRDSLSSRKVSVRIKGGFHYYKEVNSFVYALATYNVDNFVH